MKGSIAQLRRDLGRLIDPGTRHRWVALVGIGFGVSVLEAIGAVLIFVLLTLISGTSASLPVVGQIDELFGEADRRDVLLYFSGLVAAFFVLRGFAYLLQTYLQQRVAYNGGVRISSRLLAGYLRMPYPFHLQRSSAESIRNVLDAVSEIVASVFVPIVILFSEVLLVLAIVVVLVVSSPIVTIVTIAVLAPVVALLLWRLQPRLHSLGMVRQESHKESLELLQQSLGGIRDIKLLRRNSYFLTRFARARADLARTFYVRATIMDIPRVTFETALVLFILVFVAVNLIRGARLADTLALLGLLAYGIMRMLPSLNRIVANANSLRFGTTAMRDVVRDLVMTEEVADELPVDAMPLRRAVSFDGVDYSYADGGLVLRDVDLEIRKGEWFGVVGPTGGGKSTFLDLFLGLLDPTAGTVRVDDRDMRQVAASWQMNIGLVPQSIFLLDDTIKRNIAFALDDDQIDDGRVAEAAHVAQLDEFIERSPEGWDTKVGERGIRLSGGQRQRVAIARAMYRKPSVIVFDEGTSALDNETESRVMEALAALAGDPTLVIVAHRLTTVRSCDRIAVVDQGSVTDIGTFDELSDRLPSFKRAVP